MTPYFEELSALLVRQNAQTVDASHAARAAVELRIFQATLPRRVRQTRQSLEASAPDLLADFDTSAELLYRFVDELIRYTETYASLGAAQAREGAAGRPLRQQNERPGGRFHLPAVRRSSWLSSAGSGSKPTGQAAAWPSSARRLLVH